MAAKPALKMNATMQAEYNKTNKSHNLWFTIFLFTMGFVLIAHAIAIIYIRSK